VKNEKKKNSGCTINGLGKAIREFQGTYPIPRDPKRNIIVEGPIKRVAIQDLCGDIYITVGV
jgi:hypothetical protein